MKMASMRGASANAAGLLDTRFATESWAQNESPAAFSALEQQWTPRVETPLLAEYHGESPVNLEAQQLEQTLTELFDRDFNEAVANLAHEAAAQAEEFRAARANPQPSRCSRNGSTRYAGRPSSSSSRRAKPWASSNSTIWAKRLRDVV